MRDSDPMDEEFIDHMEHVAKSDVRGLRKVHTKYGNSWKKRGGVGAFFNFCRKWDRLEIRLTEDAGGIPEYDILARAAADPDVEGIIDDIRDLRRYLILVESELIAMGAPCTSGEHRDNRG